MTSALKKKKINDLYQKLESNFNELPLANSREEIVPGEGPPDAEILFIGEAPGYHEVVQRRPFVGRSGKLFRKVLLESANIPEEKVYISNIVKVRPPENRDPTPDEISAYKLYLDIEIEIIDPKLIVTLGRFSMAKFLPGVKISQVHGRLHKVAMFNSKTFFILPMYHPAAALRSTAVKEAFISDFKKIPKILDWIGSQQETLKIKNAVIENLF
jgi:uracil-DNA glycosylase